MDTSALIIKILSGAAMGYISSLISLKVIFGKYSLINSTNNYSDFKNHLAGDIEKYISKESYIENQIQKNEFKVEFNEIIDDFLNVSLDKQINNIDFKDLEDSDILKRNLDKFLKENNALEYIDFRHILDNIQITSLLNENEVNNLSGKIYQILSSTLFPDLKNIIIDAYDQLKDKKVNDFLDESTFNKINNNLNPFLYSLKENLKSIEPEIDSLIQKIWIEIKADNIMDKLEDNIKSKSIIDFIGLENKNKLTSELINHFIEFVQSDEGKGFVNKLSISLLSMAKEVDSPLINFLMPILQVRVFNFLEKNIPFFADNTKEWLRINKKEIEKIIEETIELYYSSQDLMGQFKLTVKDVIGLKISEYFQVVEKAIVKFEDYISNNASQDITFKLVEFLGNVKISDLIDQLNINIDNLSDFFNIFINNYLPKVNTKIFDSILNKKIGEINGLYNVNLKDKFGEQLQRVISTKVKELIFSDFLIDKVKDLLPSKIENFKNMTLGEIITKEKLESYLAYLPMLLMFSQGKIINTVKTQLNSNIENKTINNFVDADFLKNNLQEIYMSNTSDLVNQIDKIDIKKLYSEIKKENKDGSHFSGLINNKLSLLIENQLIKNLRIRAISIAPENLNNIIEKYIGNEYTPILFISLLIGAGFGLLTYFLESNMLSSNISIIPIVYFVVSIFISYISLEMLFKPYEKSFAFKRKNIFSENIANVIEADFKQSETLFTKKEQDNLKTYISNNDYSFFNEINSDKINDVITNKSIDYLYDYINQNSYSVLASDKITSFELNKIPKTKFDNYIKKIIDSSDSFLTNFVTKTIYSYKDKDLNSLPENLRIDIENSLITVTKTKFQDWTNDLDNTDITESLKNSLSGIEDFLNLDIKIKDAYQPDENIKNKFINQLENIIKDKIPEGINKYIEKNFIEEELTPDKEIGSLFNGELIKFARNNIDFIIERILFEFGLEKIKNEKENISENIIKSVREANKDSFLYGLGQSFFSIDSDIKNIVYLLIDTRLEPYLQEKKYELNSLITGFVDVLSKKKLEEIGLNNEILNSGNISNLVEKFVNHNTISESINHMSSALVEDILNLKLSFILNVLGIDNIQNIPEKLDEQINLTKNSFIENIKSMENIDVLINDSIKELANKGIFTKKLDLLFENIDINDINKNIDIIIKELYKTDIFNNYKTKYSDLIFNNLESKKVADFISSENLTKEIETLIVDLLNNKELKVQLTNNLKPFISDIMKNLNIILPVTSKEFIVDILIVAISESINKNSKDIIESLDTHNIIEKTVNNISASEMESLFADITQFNFKKALVYGSIGAIIGIIDVIISRYYG